MILILFLVSSFSLGTSPSYAYSQSDLDRLLETRECPECDLSDADLSDADLSRDDLRRADLDGANLYGANLYGANLRGAKLKDADLSSAYLKGADLTGANLSGADLRSARLKDADLRRADLIGADLRRADLRGADLTCAVGADLIVAEIVAERWKGQLLVPSGSKARDSSRAIFFEKEREKLLGKDCKNAIEEEESIEEEE
ncbi:low-complexity protein [Cylindrospermopsis raciborskii S01]|nr:low-complexity protein [Cylindrospermopsis raciborskii S01]